jgi:hypothetical protein
MTGRAKPDVEVYRRPTDGHWIAMCWIAGCRWKFGTEASEVETYVRQKAHSHRRQHRAAAARG